MKISIRYDEMQTADDDVTATTYYGGVIKINDLRIPASGTDRSWDFWFDVIKGIEEVLGRKLTKKELNTIESNEKFMGMGDVNLNLPKVAKQRKKARK